MIFDFPRINVMDLDDISRTLEFISHISANFFQTVSNSMTELLRKLWWHVFTKKTPIIMDIVLFSIFERWRFSSEKSDFYFSMQIFLAFFSWKKKFPSVKICTCAWKRLYVNFTKTIEIVHNVEITELYKKNSWNQLHARIRRLQYVQKLCNLCICCILIQLHHCSVNAKAQVSF